MLSAREKCYNHLRFTLMPNVRLGTNVFRRPQSSSRSTPEVFGSSAFSALNLQKRAYQREVILSFEEPADVANMGFALSPEQLKAFSDQGFLKIDFGFDQRLLDRIVAGFSLSTGQPMKKTRCR